MKVNEIFYSLQGEGKLAGVPSIFIRLAGCPLRCKWCDTKYAQSATGTEMSIDEIIQNITKWDCKFVVITGGEPMINPDLAELTQKLKKQNKHITIETAGIEFLPHTICDLMSISPKMSNSVPDEEKLAQIHNQHPIDIAVLNELIANYNYQLKFVVEDKNDLAEIHELLAKLDNIKKKNVMLMPQAATKNEYLEKAPLVADICKETGFAFSPRLQTILWDNKRGK